MSMGWGTKVGVSAVAVVVLAAGYLTADAYDVVPGVLTMEPVPAPPAPFPTAPGAVEAPPVATTLEALSDAAPVPSSGDVGALVAKLAGDKRLGTQVSVVVVDQATGEVLGSHDASAPRVPASTQKLLTAAAALTSPGADVTLSTTVVQNSPETITIVGGGDMMLAADEGDPAVVNGRAGLGDLAAQVAGQLKLTGQTTVHLQVDDSYFTGPAISSSWDMANVNAGYAAPVTALAVDIARLEDEEYAPRSADPSLAAAAIFAERLTEQGVTVTGKPSRGEGGSQTPVLGEVRSAPLGEIVGYLLQHSDNTIAELVGRLVAIDAGLPGSEQGATQAVTASVERLGVDLTGATLADLSGLGEGSKVSAAQLVAVLALLTDPARPELRSAAVELPVAGLSGTLDTRFLDSAGRGVVRAKTGSLPDITALAGTVVTADDRQLLFVVLADAVPEAGTSGARVIFDDFVGDLAGCGCQD